MMQITCFMKACTKEYFKLLKRSALIFLYIAKLFAMKFELYSTNEIIVELWESIRAFPNVYKSNVMKML